MPAATSSSAIGSQGAALSSASVSVEERGDSSGLGLAVTVGSPTGDASDASAGAGVAVEGADSFGDGSVPGVRVRSTDGS
ncbi:hypothetical protein DF186_23445, partial [Enterococcus hirae]